MHGLVALDINGETVRPSIIWCDSRAVEIGNRASKDLGNNFLDKSFNKPGNFTASKLKWVKENEPSVYKSIAKIMLPGDYLAYKFTNKMCTTKSGLSEGIMWNFTQNKVAEELLDYYQINKNLLPDVVDSFGNQGVVSEQVANELNLSSNVIISYRAGDQPNNALSLNVFEPGEVAATAGTSGVVYGISDQLTYDKKS